MTKQEFINNNLFKFIGCNCETECTTTKSEDNLYLIGLYYSGSYEDDDCYFSYVNAETGEITSDTWTTRAACPGFHTYLRPTVKTAVENGWLSQEWVDNYVTTKWNGKKISVINDLTHDLRHITEVFADKQLSLPVEISNRCRKFKESTGILLSAKKVRIPYGWNNYEVQAKVLGSDNKIYTINFFHCTCKVLDDLRDELINHVDEFDDTQAIYDYIVNYNKVDVSGCTDIDNAKAAAKEADFKEKKMLDLIAWCKSKAPEKSYEDIMEWAEKIYNKNYGK